MSEVTATFPDGFLWGAATSAHQIEGNNLASDWWELEHQTPSPAVQPSGDAADGYRRFATDIRLLADLGFNCYRFSIEWARIEPERGTRSRVAIDHYRRMVDACREVGVEPVPTLVHFTVPRWFRRAGWWTAADAPDLFSSYVESTLPIIESDVRFVCTVNEPNIAAVFASLDAGAAAEAGLPEPDPAVADALTTCHRRARDILSGIPGLRTGWTVATQAYASTGESGADEMLASHAWSRETRFLEVAAADDFVGVQAYTRTIVGPNGPLPVPEGAETTLTGWEYYPAALADGIRTASRVTGGTPILVTENGIATDDDARRIDYTRAALEGVAECIADGIDVRGYLHWSALDNFEWYSGYRPTFGLIGWDPETFDRTPKPSAHWLGSISKTNRLQAAPASASTKRWQR